MARPEAIAGLEDVDCSDRTVLVTGSTSGLGRETALALGRLGATVIVHGRDEERGKATVEAINETEGEAELATADFASLSNVESLAEQVTDDHQLDVLVNNAGGFFSDPRMTEDGVEYTIGVNHLAPFYLTHLLLPELRDSQDPRIVNVASDAHQATRSFDFDALTSIEDYSAWRAYSRSKLSNILFTYELAPRLEDIQVNCLHPGFVPGSKFYRDFPVYFRAAIKALALLPDTVSRLASSSVADGASTILYLAVADESRSVSGEYFFEREKRRSSSLSHDEELQTRLWDWSIDHVPLEKDDVPER